MKDEWVKYTVCSKLDMAEDSAYGVRSGRLRQEGHLPQLLGSACPCVCTCLLMGEQAWTDCVHMCSSYVQTDNTGSNLRQHAFFTPLTMKIF